jgi:hypothetical protein
MMAERQKSAFLLFTGTNTRAWTVLARYFELNNVPYYLIAFGAQDVCHQTEFSKNILFVRRDKLLTRVELENIGRALSEQGLKKAIVCPTSEFINAAYFREEPLWNSHGLWLAAACANDYATLTNKQSAYSFFNGGPLKISRVSNDIAAFDVCVAKPKENIVGGKVLYPQFIFNEDDRAKFLAEFDEGDFFFEPYIDGKSYYLCAYLNREGESVCYGQRNQMQQPDGKSIVAAVEDDLILDNGVASWILAKLLSAGYRGPVMVELYRTADEWHFIEMNPRFWGPLLLSLHACPDLLASFVSDWLGIDYANTPKAPSNYIWYKGGIDYISSLRVYDDIENVPSFFEKHKNSDVYNFSDTESLTYEH